MKAFQSVGSELRSGVSWAEEVLESLSDGVSIHSPDFRILWANKILRDGWGEDILGRPCYEVYEQSPEPCEGCAVREAFSTGKPAIANRLGIDKRGRYWWVENSATPLRDAAGHIVACVEVVRNVTERKLIEEESDRRNRELSSLASLTNKLSPLTDRISVLSTTLEHLMEQGIFAAGIAFMSEGPGEYLLAGSAGGLPEESIPTRLLASGGLTRLLRTDNGRVRWWKGKAPKSLDIPESLCKMKECAAVALMSIGCQPGCSCFLMLGSAEIPDQWQKAHVEALAAQVSLSLKAAWMHERISVSEKRYRDLFEASPVGMISIDDKGVITAENPAMLKMMGMRGKKGLVGQRLDTVSSVVGAGLSGQVSRLLAGAEVNLEEVPFVSLAGRRVSISISCIPFKHSDGKIQGALVCVTDVTEKSSLREQVEYMKASKV